MTQRPAVAGSLTVVHPSSLSPCSTGMTSSCVTFEWTLLLRRRGYRARLLPFHCCHLHHEISFTLSRYHGRLDRHSVRRESQVYGYRLHSDAPHPVPVSRGSVRSESDDTYCDVRPPICINDFSLNTSLKAKVVIQYSVFASKLNCLLRFLIQGVKALLGSLSNSRTARAC
jgi:hypothetical protein